MSARVKVAILRCPTHGFYGVSLDERRLTSGKCCGSWRIVQSWYVAAADITELLPQEAEAKP